MITCQRCQRPNEPGHRFCLGCGAPLGQRPDAAPVPSTGYAPYSGAAQPASGFAGQAPAPYPFDPPAAYSPSPLTAPAPATHSGFVDPFGPPPPRAAQSAEARCSTCGASNPAGNRFCGSCGSGLQAARPAAPAAAAPAAAPPQAAPLPGWRHPSHTPLGQAVGSTGTVFAQQAPTPALARAQLVLLNEEGAPAGALTIEGGPHRIGRRHGPPFADDAYLDPNHATVTATTAGLLIEDHGSLNGIFQRVDSRIEVHSGDQFRVGQELLIFEKLPEHPQSADQIEILGSPNPGYWGRLGVLVAPRFLSRALPLAGPSVVVGRDAGDFLFPDDGYVSARHCQLSFENGLIYLEDLGSSNGTYARVRSQQTVPHGALLLIGQQLFRVDPA